MNLFDDKIAEAQRNADFVLEAKQSIAVHADRAEQLGRELKRVIQGMSTLQDSLAGTHTALEQLRRDHGESVAAIEQQAQERAQEKAALRVRDSPATVLLPVSADLSWCVYACWLSCVRRVRWRR